MKVTFKGNEYNLLDTGSHVDSDFRIVMIVSYVVPTILFFFCGIAKYYELNIPAGVFVFFGGLGLFATILNYVSLKDGATYKVKEDKR